MVAVAAAVEAGWAASGPLGVLVLPATSVTILAPLALTSCSTSRGTRPRGLRLPHHAGRGLVGVHRTAPLVAGGCSRRIDLGPVPREFRLPCLFVVAGSASLGVLTWFPGARGGDGLPGRRVRPRAWPVARAHHRGGHGPPKNLTLVWEATHRAESQLGLRWALQGLGTAATPLPDWLGGPPRGDTETAFLYTLGRIAGPSWRRVAVFILLAAVVAAVWRRGQHPLAGPR